MPRTPAPHKLGLSNAELQQLDRTHALVVRLIARLNARPALLTREQDIGVEKLVTARNALAHVIITERLD